VVNYLDFTEFMAATETDVIV